MKILPDPIAFDWDEGNLDKNLVKHNVTNQEAEEIFSNKPFLGSKDTTHSDQETRYQALGKTTKERLLFISFAIRNKKVRPISCRDMNKRERSKYEKIKIDSKI